jgi:hypothetical protein
VSGSVRIAPDASVVTDGHAGYNSESLGEAAARGESADQGRATRERRHPELPLDDLAPEALASPMSVSSNQICRCRLQHVERR